MKKNNNRKGFTIVELVIVIAVIAILAAVLIPTFSGIIDKANNSAALQEARNEYTEYVAGIDYSTATAAQDLIIKTSKGTFVCVIDASMVNVVYKDFETAQKAIKTDIEAEIPTGKTTATITWGAEVDGVNVPTVAFS